MRYPIAIEAGDEARAFGVVVPDLPGCFSGGDSLDEAVAGAAAAAAWIEAALDAGRAISAPSGLEALRQYPAYAGWRFRVVAVDSVSRGHTSKR